MYARGRAGTQSSGLVIGGVGVQGPGGALGLTWCFYHLFSLADGRFGGVIYGLSELNGSAPQADSHLGRSPSATDHWMGVGQIQWSVWLLLDRFRFCECRELALQALRGTATPALSQGP